MSLIDDVNPSTFVLTIALSLAVARDRRRHMGMWTSTSLLCCLRSRATMRSKNDSLRGLSKRRSPPKFEPFHNIKVVILFWNHQWVSPKCQNWWCAALRAKIRLKLALFDEIRWFLPYYSEISSVSWMRSFWEFVKTFQYTIGLSQLSEKLGGYWSWDSDENGAKVDHC